MIKILGHRISLVQLQWIFWTGNVALTFGSYLQDEPPVPAIIFAVTKTLHTVIIIYANVFWLIPKFYQRGKKAIYFLLALALLLVVCLFRVQLRGFVLEHLYPAEVATSVPYKLFIDYLIQSVVIVFFSFVFRIAFDYFKVQKERDLLKKHTAEMELNLLKSQVQPHFLFNTLNNIYFVAQRQSPETAVLLEKLSNIMRYFVDEVPKHEIPFIAEINFVRNYIDLEMLRMKHPLKTKIHIDGDMNGISTPPMILIPLIENVFKHGINKRTDDNILILHIRKSVNQLTIEVQNRLFPSVVNKNSGTGLQNLRMRLQLLYGNRFKFITQEINNNFIVQLNIPL